MLDPEIVAGIVAVVGGVLAVLFKTRPAATPTNGLKLAKELLENKDAKIKELENALSMLTERIEFMQKQVLHLEQDLAAARGLADAFKALAEKNIRPKQA